MPSTMYAYWSQEYVNRGHRTQIWSTPDGKEIEACFVLSTPDPPNSWPDIKHLGVVVAWLRHGQRSLLPR